MICQLCVFRFAPGGCAEPALGLATEVWCCSCNGLAKGDVVAGDRLDRLEAGTTILKDLPERASAAAA